MTSSKSAKPSPDLPVLDELMTMMNDNAERSGLDPRTYMMVRMAALAASDAAPASWAVNLGAAAETGLTKTDVQGVMVAIAPVIGTARTVTAAGSALRGIGLAAALDDPAVGG
jgi:4-carboxymuconolactone decarboxylase